MRIGEVELAVRKTHADGKFRARIVNEGPVALADMLNEVQARRAARTLTGLVAGILTEQAPSRNSG
jgi:hypothetical protein